MVFVMDIIKVGHAGVNKKTDRLQKIMAWVSVRDPVPAPAG